MASQWFCKLFDQEMGPLPFQDLLEMVRTGTLTENDPVRRQGSQQWILAGEVVGLFRSADRPPDEVKRPSESSPPIPEESVPAPRGASQRGPLGKRGLIGTGVALASVGLLAAIWASRPARFPESARNQPSFLEIQLTKVRPSPKEPSVPDLEECVPLLVPGLEKITPAYSPALTADLRTIVFAAPGHPGTKYDLYLASRESVCEPFGPPRLIERSVSPEIEANPALSPNGRELFFQRSDTQPQIFYCRRDSLSNDFGEPVLWPVPGYDPTTQRLERPQFVGPLRVIFVVKELTFGKCSLRIADRKTPQDEFGPLREVSTWNIVARSFVTQDGLRSYVGWQEGLALVARRGPSEPFGKTIPIADAGMTGPFDGPSWIAPQEDVIFYCSPGPGRKRNSSRRLWMLRF